MRLPLFIIKYTRYEYWPMWLFYFPILPYWLWLSIKNKSLSYFSVANPGIELGGFFGESKSDILKLINPNYLPKTIEVDRISISEILNQLSENEMNYPLIAKPDVGERGDDVCKLHSKEDLINYNVKSHTKYIIQEFITFDIELGVLYCRLPNSQTGNVTSITLKEFLTVEGNGTSTIKDLMIRNTRARFQIERLSNSIDLNLVVPKGEIKLLEPIGNHCRGTRFIDRNDLINNTLNKVFDDISLPIEGFYYGRFDLKVNSFSDLYNGKNIKIMELNGASSEPGHIYDAQKNNLFTAYKDLMKHWRILSDISKQNIDNGYMPVSFKVIVKSYLKFAFKSTKDN